MQRYTILDQNGGPSMPVIMPAIIICNTSLSQGPSESRLDIQNPFSVIRKNKIRMLAKKMARERRILFDVSLDPSFSYSNIAALGESAYQMRQDKTIPRTLDELDAMANE